MDTFTPPQQQQKPVPVGTQPRLMLGGPQSAEAQQGGQDNAGAGTPQIAPAVAPTAPQQAQPPQQAAQPAPAFQTYFGTNPTTGTPGQMFATATQQAGGNTGAGYLQALASQFAQQAASQATPDTAFQKAQAQNTIATQKKAAQDQLMASAARRGTLQSGQVGANERRLADAATSQMVGAYGQIDQNAQDKAFQNMLASSGMLSNLAQQLIGQEQFGQTFGLQQELGRGNLGVAQGNLALQGELGRGGLDLNNRQFAEQIRQFDLGRGDSLAAQGAASSAAARNADMQQAAQQRQYDLEMAKLILGML